MLRGKVGAVLPGLRGTSRDVTATIDPDHDGKLRRLVLCGRPDIKGQTVLADTGVAEDHVGVELGLHAMRAELTGVTDSLPLLHRLRRLPAEGTDRGCGIGNAEEGAN